MTYANIDDTALSAVTTRTMRMISRRRKTVGILAVYQQGLYD